MVLGDTVPVVRPTDTELSIWQHVSPRRSGGLVRSKAHVFKDCVDWDDFYRTPDKLNPDDWESKMLAGFRGEWFAHVLEDSRRILDVGCGFGFPSFYLARYGHEVVGVDPSVSEIDTARRVATRMEDPKGVSFEVTEEYNLPYGDGSFDGAAFSTSLECADDPLALLSEVRRVLAPGSRMAIEEEDRSLAPWSHPVWEKLRWAFFDGAIWLWYETRIREPYLDRRYMLRLDPDGRVSSERKKVAASVLARNKGLPVADFIEGETPLDSVLPEVVSGEWSEARGYDPVTLKELLETAGFGEILFWLQPDGKELANSLAQSGLLGKMPEDVRGVLRAVVRSTQTTNLPVSCTLRCRLPD